MIHTAWPGATFGSMQPVRRRSDVGLDMVVDAGVVIVGVTLTALAAWAPSGLTGSAIAGPSWLLALLPLLMGTSLALRRRAPLLMWTAIGVVIVLQYLVTRNPPEGLEWFVPFAGAYSLGVHAGLRRSAVGLGISLVMILAARAGLSIIPLLVFWLVGWFVHTRRRAAFLAARNASLQRQSEQAAADERARIARELHDIVAHHLSVIVLQAAGARASGKGAEATLEKIENSGRQALSETRRLLGVLRDPCQQTGLAPQPGIDDLDALAASLRAAGLPVNLVVSGGHEAVPAAVDVSVYRIVQEALTNVLKHAGHACADVTIGVADEAVTIEITDDGTGQSGDRTGAGGHGRAGMRERVAIFGGELCTGPLSGGGFAVHARLPLGDSRFQADGLS
jgi:signal transduction histidine kinase